ncbi:MAG: 1-phosphofructokinase [Pygmaiobacter massiliensis]|nr:1-phosphofructokinase [Pygmaiobacter massiliensis]
MIYTVTLNPALDYLVWLASLQEGEVNRAQKETIQYGGKGINVSVVLQTLGVQTTALGFTAGFTGKALQKELEEMGLTTDFVWQKQGLTRINVKIKGERETELNARGPIIEKDALTLFWQKLKQVKDGDTVVLSGSVPDSLPGDIYRQILAHFSGRPVRFAVDAAGDYLWQTLSYKPFFIKPNRSELQQLFESVLENDSQLIDCARKLQQAGARNVLISLAGDGSLLLDEKGEVHRQGVPEGIVQNSVGAGDSMVAGFIAGFLETGNYGYAQRLGTVCGAATAFSEGLAKREQIFALLHSF